MMQIKEISAAVNSIQNRFYVTGSLEKEVEITLPDDTEIKFPMSTSQKEKKMKAVLKNSKPSPFGKGIFITLLLFHFLKFHSIKTGFMYAI